MGYLAYGTRVDNASPLYTFTHRTRPDSRRLLGTRGLVPTGCGDVLLFLLDRPRDWRTSDALLARHFGLGLFAMRSRLAKLVDAGFLLKKSYRDGGRFRWIWVATEDPLLLPLSSERVTQCTAHASGTATVNPALHASRAAATAEAVIPRTGAPERENTPEPAPTTDGPPPVVNHIFSKKTLREVPGGTARPRSRSGYTPPKGRPTRTRPASRTAPVPEPLRDDEAVGVLQALHLPTSGDLFDLTVTALRGTSAYMLYNQLSIGTRGRRDVEDMVRTRLHALTGTPRTSV